MEKIILIIIKWLICSLFFSSAHIKFLPSINKMKPETIIKITGRGKSCLRVGTLGKGGEILAVMLSLACVEVDIEVRYGFIQNFTTEISGINRQAIITSDGGFLFLDVRFMMQRRKI